MTAWQVIRWWELRRILYNAVLFVIGVLAVMGMELFMSMALPAGEDAVEPLVLIFGGLLFALMANLCYTLGWVVELWSRRTNPDFARERAKWSFRAGLLASCVLTTLPFWFGYLFWALNLGRTR